LKTLISGKLDIRPQLLIDPAALDQRLYDVWTHQQELTLIKAISLIMQF